jgi:hypothetical protein
VVDCEGLAERVVTVELKHVRRKTEELVRLLEWRLRRGMVLSGLSSSLV